MSGELVDLGLAPTSRISVLCAVLEGARTTDELCAATGLGRSAVHRHIHALREVGLVSFVDAQGRVHCEARVSPECNGRRQHKHHILPRGRGGADVIENALPACHACHQEIHRNPAEATRLGLLKGTNP